MVSFGIKTTPMRVEYAEILRIWQEADEIPEIEDAWLWDHLMPLSGPPDGKIYEGWTLLAALAAQTRRLRLGLLVTNNRIRYPAALGKIATTVDVISGGRLIMGLGVGGTRRPGDTTEHPGIAEYQAYGLPFVPPAEGLERLAETIAILKRMWTEDVFDFDGKYSTLTGTRNEPKSPQPGGPPLLIGAMGPRTLRLVAEEADIWNIPGPPHHSVEFIAERVAILEAHCEDLGRDPAEIGRSVQLIVSQDDPEAVRNLVLELIEVGMTHIVLAPRPPYPQGLAQFLTDEIIKPVKAELKQADSA